jgi:hypothetical protein
MNFAEALLQIASGLRCASGMPINRQAPCVQSILLRTISSFQKTAPLQSYEVKLKPEVAGVGHNIYKVGATSNDVQAHKCNQNGQPIPALQRMDGRQRSLKHLLPFLLDWVDFRAKIVARNAIDFLGFKHIASRHLSGFEYHLPNSSLRATKVCRHLGLATPVARTAGPFLSLCQTGHQCFVFVHNES